MRYYFNYKGKSYGLGSIIKIYDNKSKNYKFKTYFVFDDVISNNIYRFRALNDNLEYFNFTNEDLDACIEKVTREEPVINPNVNKNVSANYIDGIIEAWTWYILVMIGSFFLKGIGVIIGLQIFASIIFWYWRNKKMRGK